MTHDPNDPIDEVVKVYSGPLVEVEVYQRVLKESGIDSRVVGTDLTASFGSAIPDSIELWVHRGDAEKAVAAIQREQDRKAHSDTGGRRHPHPTDET
jgi:hypothetical protein